MILEDLSNFVEKRDEFDSVNMISLVRQSTLGIAFVVAEIMTFKQKNRLIETQNKVEDLDDKLLGVMKLFKNLKNRKANSQSR